MSHYDSHPAGNFCWIELATSDVAAARSFYSQIFGWNCEEVPAGHMMYTLGKLDGREAAGIYELLPQMRADNVPPHWMPYVSVANADQAAATATAAGGKACWGPSDVMDVARMGTILDPQGAVFAIWQPIQSHGVRILGVHGTMTWCELMTTDTEAAKTFYGRVFGWTNTVMPMPTGEYTVFVNGPKPIGGTLKLGPEHGGAPPNWLIYFHVDDCDAAVSKAVSLGGKALTQPMDIPGAGRLCVLSDPQGAVFAVIKPASFAANERE